MERQPFSFFNENSNQPPQEFTIIPFNTWNGASLEFIPSNPHLPYPYRSQESTSPVDSPFGSFDDSRTPIPSSIEPIFKALKTKEKNGYDSAREYGVSCMDMVPSRLQWRLYLELADIAKRESIIRDARAFYKKATLLHPHASQPWLEYAKLEDECGALVRCQRILATALQCCPFNEGLMVKAIKLEEKLGNYNQARAILSGLRYVSLEKGWRVMLEGGLLEARAGNTYVARKIFKYLMQNAAGYGNVFQESSLLEERCENYYRAIEIAEKGLEENPRYGPLYLTVLRLQEKVACGDLSQTRQVVERAIKFIPKELKWKVYFEAAQIEDRAGNLDLSRQNYVHSVANCPNNLLWKVWIAGARTELRANSPAANKLIFRSLRDVPAKKKAQVWLEWAHIEEFQGNLDKARQVLKQAREEASQEWKVFLETILLEIRANNTAKAIQECREALKIHTGTGRLWALLIQLRQDEGEEAQLEVFKEALQEVPKSGEVWCEGARIYLRRQDWAEARKYLEFAIHFTPQFGDSFIEYLRLELLENGDVADLAKLELLCVNAEPNYGTLWMYCKEHPLYSTQRVLKCAREIFGKVGIDGGDTVLALGKLESPLKITKDEEWRLIFGCDDLKP